MILLLALTACLARASISDLAAVVFGLQGGDPASVLSMLEGAESEADRLESELRGLRDRITLMRDRAEESIEQSLDTHFQLIGSVFNRALQAPSEVMESIKVLVVSRDAVGEFTLLSERLRLKQQLALEICNFALEHLRSVQMAIGVVGFVINSAEKDLTFPAIRGYRLKLKRVLKPTLPRCLRRVILAHLYTLDNEKVLITLRRSILSLYNINEKLADVSRIFNAAKKEYSPVVETAFANLLVWRAHLYRLSMDKEARLRYFPETGSFTSVLMYLCSIFNDHAPWLLPAYRRSRNLPMLPFGSELPSEAFLELEKAYQLEKEATGIFGDATQAMIVSLWCTTMAVTNRFIPPGETLAFRSHELLNKMNVTLMPNQIALSRAMFEDANQLFTTPVVSYKDFAMRRLSKL